MGPQVDLPAFAAAQEDGAFVIDVREPREYLDGHVPGAQLMPLAQVLSRLSELPRDEPVYILCASGNRSRFAARWLCDRGLDAASVAGGAKAWIAQGRPLVRGTQPNISVA